MNRINYQRELDRILKEMEEPGEQSKTPACGSAPGRPGMAAPPELLLHSCCAPCSSYVLECLSVYFGITVFYYNPNITERGEYQRRAEEQKRLISVLNEAGGGFPIRVLEGEYAPELFFEAARGLEGCPEGGERCFRCYELRLRAAACMASRLGADYFGTTLTVSPLKDAHKLNEIGQRLAGEYGVAWLPSDFKKKDGYRRSVELSRRYGLYRQDYCGCVYSRAERERKSRSRTQ